MKINGLQAAIDRNPNMMASLYVDDYQLAYSHSDLAVVQRQMQASIDGVTEGTGNNGYTFSKDKTKTVHVIMQHLHIRPDIELYNELIRYKNF